MGLIPRSWRRKISQPFFCYYYYQVYYYYSEFALPSPFRINLLKGLCCIFASETKNKDGLLKMDEFQIWRNACPFLCGWAK